MKKKTTIIKIYEGLRYVAYFLGGALLIKQGKLVEGLTMLGLGSATLGKDKLRGEEMKNIKQALPEISK